LAARHTGTQHPVWGTWFIILGGTAGAALLIVGLAFGGWAVLVALAIFVIVGVALLAGASWRRSGEYVDRRDEAKAPQMPGRESTPGPSGQPRSGGAPVSGEGD
jgi:hypothetical protein